MAKTKALISFAVTAKLICVFVFPNAKSWFSHNEAQIDFKHYFPYFLFPQSMKAPDLKEKLEESEKLLREMRKTWEEKLTETEKIHQVSR